MGEYAVRRRVTSQLKEGAKIAIVMDFPSSNEVRLNKILAGDFIINKICRMTGIQIEDCMLTHTFQLKPAQDNPQNFFTRDLNIRLCARRVSGAPPTQIPP